MKKDVTFIVSFIAIAFMILVIIGGWYYIFKNSQSGPSGSAEVDPTIKPVATSTNRSPKIPAIAVTNSDIQKAFKADSDAVLVKTDVFFKDPGTPSPKLALKMDDAVLLGHIEVMRRDITQTLISWRELLKTIATTSIEAATPSVVKKVTEYADTVHEYITELQNVVDSLTPENSGLTQPEIDSYKAAVSTAIDETTPTTTNAGSDNSNTANQGNGSDPSTSSGSPEQQSTSSDPTDPSLTDPSGSSSGNNDSLPPPPVNQPDHSGTPRLIEGANPIM